MRRRVGSASTWKTSSCMSLYIHHDVYTVKGRCEFFEKDATNAAGRTLLRTDVLDIERAAEHRFARRDAAIELLALPEVSERAALVA